MIALRMNIHHKIKVLPGQGSFLSTDEPFLPCRYGKFRPSTEHILRSPARRGKWQRAWWQYAINAVRSDVHAKIYRPTWRYLSWRR